MSRHRFRRGFTPLAKPEEKFGRTVAHVLQTKAKRMHSAVQMQTKTDADCSECGGPMQNATEAP